MTALAMAALATGCKPKDGQAPNTGNAAGDPNGGGQVEQQVVYERMPDGSVRKTTITKRSVSAP